MMLVPAHSLSGLKALLKLIFRLNRAERYLEGSGQECGAVIVRKGERLFFGQIKFTVRGVVAHIAAGRLAAQPFAHVAFRGAGALRKFRGSLMTARRQSFI